MTSTAKRWRSQGFANARSLIQHAISLPTPVSILHRLTRSPVLPLEVRRQLHLLVGKRVTFPPGSFFSYTLKPVATELRLLHSGAANHIFWLGSYEPETLSLFLEKAASASVVLDIGARDGIYALFAAVVNPGAQVLAFEPEPQGFEALQINLSLNRSVIDVDRVKAFPFPLSDFTGRSTLYLAGGNTSLNPSFRIQAEAVQSAVHRGDDVVEQAIGTHAADLIKIDTESTEPAVLRGLSQTLQRSRPDIICEVLAGRTEDELEAVLRPLGYHLYWITGHGLIRMPRIIADKTYRYSNYLFSTRLHGLSGS